MPTLNDDLFPGVSSADVLSTPLAYVATSAYARLRGISGRVSDWLTVAPALAALVALIIHIVTV